MTDEELYRAEGEAIAALSLESGAQIKKLTERGDIFMDCAVDIALAVADDPRDIAALELLSKKTQAEAVNDRVEQTWFTLGIPELHGGRGTFEERRAAIKAKLQRDELARANS